MSRREDESEDSFSLEQISHLICSEAEELRVSDRRTVFKGNVATPITTGYNQS